MMHNRRCSAAQPPDRVPHDKVAQRRYYRAQSLSSNSMPIFLINSINSSLNVIFLWCSR
ncbi:MAG: hypothetical protein LBQ50_12025 [Planctomycetaceae bacterium]|nr:hypothetical protein [Planctomycetaceae bacterium]